MKLLVVPQQNAGWKEKRRLLEEIISSHPKPPYIYNDVLIIVPTSRMKRAYGRMLLDIVQRKFGVAALVLPEIQTLHQLFEHLYASLQGPRLIDENSRIILLEGIVKGHLTRGHIFGQKPDLLAPALSTELAKMIEQLSAAGVSADDLARRITAEDFSDKQQVTLLIAAYRDYERELQRRNITDPAGMRAHIRDHVESGALAGYTRIILDGIHDAGRIETEILRKTVVGENCTCIVQATSAELITKASACHPLSLTRDFLSLLGTSPEAGGDAPGTSELFLSSVLFSDKAFKTSAAEAPDPLSFSKDIRLLSAVNAREEVSLIASSVKQSLKQGTPPDSILVAFPGLEAYGPLVEEIFTDYGIPYNRALGRQLSSSPVAAAVVSLLQACQEDFSGPSLVRIFSSAFLKFGETPELAPALDRLIRHCRITGGKHKLLSALNYQMPEEQGNDIISGPIKDLFDCLEPFSRNDTAPLSLWMERFSDLMTWSGLGARVALIKGPLSINLQAYKKMKDTLSSLAQAGKLFPDYRYTFNEWYFLLKKTFMHTRYQVPPEDEGGVQILGLEESMGYAWSEIYFGGLADGAFPQRLPQNIFLPELILEAMGVRTLEKARLNAAGHFYRLLLSADKITLTYPENEGDRPVVPSPFLEELTPLKQSGLINRGIEKTSGIQSSLMIEKSHSIPELAKAIGLVKNDQGLTDLLNSSIRGMAGIAAAIAHEPLASAPDVLPKQKRSFSVTELDLYLRCPYDYLVTQVLGLEPLEEATEDISPLDRGSKVHTILKNFYLTWSKPVTQAGRVEARMLLKKLADDAFAEEADTFRNRREKELFLTVMAERFLDGEEEFWKQGMNPAYLEQKIDRFPLVLSNGEEVELSAKIDRIDVDNNGNFIIVDYKTGKYPLPKMTTDQDIFQLPVYAVMAQSALKGSGPELTKPIGLAYYDLAGKTDAGARDVVLYNKEERDDHPSSKPKASSKRAEEFDAILKQSMVKTRKAIEGILAGEFSSNPQDENRCRYCPLGMMCEKGETP
ncbi:MAG TPA: PD-(D/E)XK nuclease family protein [Nitrospirota bacterium]|nr:PD-(D/E)XK nuclease family protein [Nitrospirota bacterium]